MQQLHIDASVKQTNCSSGSVRCSSQSLNTNSSGSQYSKNDQGRTKKKVFIFHFDDEYAINLAIALVQLDVDVTIDLFQHEHPPDNWELWYEQNIKSSDVVLCIITKSFFANLHCHHRRAMCYSFYNLMGNSMIAAIPIFLDAPKVMEYVPLAMQGTTCYCISSQRLTVLDEEFASLYAFLTGQNRMEKPQTVVLSSKTKKR